MGFMIGVAAALLVIFLLAWLTVKNPGAGWIVSIIALILVIIAVYFYFQEDQRVQKQKSLIPLEQIQLSNISHQLAYGNYYKLTGKLSNKSSRYRLQAIDLNIIFYKCPDPESTLSQCHKINSLQHTLRTLLDAQKSKPIEVYLLLNDELLGDVSADKLRWQVDVVYGLGLDRL